MTVNNWGSDGEMNVAKGGTARGTHLAYGVVCGGTTATGNQQSVAVGTSGHVMTSNGAGALPSMQAMGGGGGSLVFLNAQTASNSASIEWDNTYITSTYNNYIVVFRMVNAQTDVVNMRLRYSNDNGSTFETSNYDSSAYEGHNTTETQSTTYVLIIDRIGNGTNEGNLCGWVRIYNPTESGLFTTTQGLCGFINSSNFGNTAYTTSQYQVAEANNAIQFSWTAGNITDGEFILYGVSES